MKPITKKDLKNAKILQVVFYFIGVLFIIGSSSYSLDSKQLTILPVYLISAGFALVLAGYVNYLARRTTYLEQELEKLQTNKGK